MIYESIALPIETSRQYQTINITEKIRESLNRTGLVNGFINLYCPHTTAGLLINEPESGLLKDMEELFARIVPSGDYQHDRTDSNARSHLAACLINTSLVIPVNDTKLALGTWQGIIFCEFDGPRSRKLNLVVIGTE